jgi:hexosaminidase
MRKYVYISLLLLTSALFWQCMPGREASRSETSKLRVSWKLLSNFSDVKDGFHARFVLKNEGETTLGASNWALFFNMAPRPILPNRTPQPARVEHINGDWYKLVPEKDFTLTPGDSVTIPYAGTEGVIKETDAPLGLYLVYYDENGKETGIEQIDRYTIEPFTAREQVLRGEADQLSVPDATQRYLANLALSPVPENELIPIIPSPVSYQKGNGTFQLDGALAIRAGAGLEQEARFLRKSLFDITKVDLPISGESGRGINLSIEPLTINGTSKEAYRLTIQKDGITVVGSDAAGVFYGIHSLLALIPYESYGQKNVELPIVKVEDAPRFHTRGLHLDVSRNFQTKETILRTLDLMATYKLNHFLLYTTEDEGWRLEIEGLPELTEVGAQRQHTSGPDAPALHPAYGSGPVAYQKGTHGSGYYTKADFVEILKYAAERHIKVIPELNFPAHALAAIKAMEARYARLMKEGKEKEANEYRLIDPDDRSEYLSAQGYKNNVVSVARESTYRFYEKVVDEMAKMYQQAGLKMDVIHAGGDEVPEGAWTKSPLAARLMQENPEIKDPRNLQAYFFGKLVERLRKRNLTIHGWEEVALLKDETGTYRPNPAFAGKNVVPYIWNNLFDNRDLGYRLANMGYPVILCNVSNFYFDLAYNNDPKEPGLYWAGFVDTRDNWTFAPYNMVSTTLETNMGRPLDEVKDFAGMERLRPEARKNIIGLEAQLWSETVKGRDMMEYYTLPKLLGFAESAWSKERAWEAMPAGSARKKLRNSQWNAFASTLAAQALPKLSRLNGGYNYRLPLPGARVINGVLEANSEYPGLMIRYTTDGTEPSGQSPLYTGPVPVTGPVRLKAFDKAGRSGRTVEINDLSTKTTSKNL